MNCDLGVVSLSWDGRNGTNSYVVSAVAANRTTRLTTNVTAAHFYDLSCGQNYSLAVWPHSQHCSGSSSTPASVQTCRSNSVGGEGGGVESASVQRRQRANLFCVSGPCPPARISTVQDCLSAIVMVSWEGGNGSDFFTATMQADGGVSEICMSDTNQCSVPRLPCGRNFSVTVTASNRQCEINSTQTTSLQSGQRNGESISESMFQGVYYINVLICI